MGLRQIRFILSSDTAAIGPYNLYANSVSAGNLIDSNLSLTTLKAGVIYALDDAINTFLVYNTTCATSQSYSVPAASPSPTPTNSPTATPTRTPSITPTITATPTITVTPSITPSITPSPSPISTNFGSGFQDGCVVHVLLNDKITTGGFITSYNGTAKDSYVQLNLDGSINTTFVNYSNGGNIYAVGYNPTTSEYILAGFIYDWNGGPVAQCMVSVNAITGARNNTFNTNLGSGFSSNVKFIDFQSGGAIIALGDFTSVNGVARNRIARININGTVDSTFSYNSNDISATYRVRVFSDDKIFVCADMTNFNGTAVSNAVWLQSDGTLYTAMGTGFTEYFGSVTDARETDNGRIVAVGSFRKFNGVISRGIVRINTDGSRDASFTSPFSTDVFIEGMAIRPDGKIIVIGGNITNKIACLNDDGSIDTLSYNFGTGFDSPYNATISVLENNDLIVTGCFTTFNGATANRIVRISANVISPSVTRTPSVTPTVTPTVTRTPSVTPTITPTITPSRSPATYFSYTNLNYSNISSAIICNGGGTTGNNLFWINNATLTAGMTVYSDSGLTTLAPSGYYGGGGQYLFINPDGTVSHPFVACPSVTPTVTPTRTPTVTPSITTTPVNVYKYYFEMTGFNYAYTGGGIMTLNSTGGNASFNTNYNLILSNQNSYNLSGTVVTAESGTYIQRIELIAYDGTTVVSTIYPGTTSYTFGTSFMTSTGTGAGQFQTIKVYFTPSPSPTPTVTPTPTATPSTQPMVYLSYGLTEQAPCPVNNPVYYQYYINSGNFLTATTLRVTTDNSFAPAGYYFGNTAGNTAMIRYWNGSSFPSGPVFCA